MKLFLIQQKFIEHERVYLLEYLQEYFNNKKVNFIFKVEKNREELTSTAPFSTKEKFIRIAEKYPLIKELKDRLRLELGY